MKDKDKKKASNKTKGKMAALSDLRDMASEMMGSDLSELKKVTVASPDKEGLQKGLKKAKELIEEEDED